MEFCLFVCLFAAYGLIACCLVGLVISVKNYYFPNDQYSDFALSGRQRKLLGLDPGASTYVPEKPKPAVPEGPKPASTSPSSLPSRPINVRKLSASGSPGGPLKSTPQGKTDYGFSTPKSTAMNVDWNTPGTSLTPIVSPAMSPIALRTPSQPSTLINPTRSPEDHFISDKETLHRFLVQRDPPSCIILLLILRLLSFFLSHFSCFFFTFFFFPVLRRQCSQRPAVVWVSVAKLPNSYKGSAANQHPSADWRSQPIWVTICPRAPHSTRNWRKLPWWVVRKFEEGKIFLFFCTLTICSFNFLFLLKKMTVAGRARFSTFNSAHDTHGPRTWPSQPPALETKWQALCSSPKNAFWLQSNQGYSL